MSARSFAEGELNKSVLGKQKARHHEPDDNDSEYNHHYQERGFKP
jgi:hypothetical protein